MTVFNRFFATALLLFTSNISAMWVEISDCKLIDQSVIIVEAEFTGTTRIKLSKNTQSIEPGILQIKQVFKGNNMLDNVLVEQPMPKDPRSSIDIFFTRGQKGIWFLTKGKTSNSGIYSANDYQRYWPEDKLQKLNNLLSNCPDQD